MKARTVLLFIGLIFALGLLASRLTNDAMSMSEMQANGSSGLSPTTSALPGNFVVDVSIQGSELGQLEVTSGPLETVNSNGVWMKHELSVRNAGPGQVQLMDNRSGEFLGKEKGLLVHERDCGPAQQEQDQPRIDLDGVACAAYAYEPYIAANQTIMLPISLRKGLAGMGPVEEGTYEFSKDMSYRTADYELHTSQVLVTYVVKRQ